MKKRKQQKAAAASETAASMDDADLKALIQSHGAFFDTLIELIPAKFYLPQNDDDSENPKPYFRGLSKAAKASMKRQSKENLKLHRRNRHDPEKLPQSSTLDLLKQSLEAPPPPEDGDDFPPTTVDPAEREKTLTYEELRQKLRKKIESLRGNRAENVDGKSNRMKKKEEGERKRKRYEEVNGIGKDKEKLSEEEVIEYGKVKIGDDDEQKRKKKMPKVKELQRAKKLVDAKKENPKIAEKEWWKAAESRAMGVKVHDDPKLLRESLKKEKKRKEKSSEKWKERVSSQQKVTEDRQKKRKDNIVGRIQDNKARKIAKREKKLMRPGFEGRKKEYITKD